MIGRAQGNRLVCVVVCMTFSCLLVAFGTPSVKGSLLDDVGQFSVALNQLVDGLLERASVLADVVIEAAREEQCEGTCVARGKLAASNQTTSSQESQLKEDTAERARTDPGESSSSNCKLLAIPLNRRDLPLASMDACCLAYGACYGECGRPKVDCDQQFQHCLKSSCLASFGPNATSISGLAQHETTATPRPLIHYHHELDEPVPAAPLEASHKRDKYRACRLASKVLIIGNLAFGCVEYKRIQQRSCCLS